MIASTLLHRLVLLGASSTQDSTKLGLVGVNPTGHAVFIVGFVGRGDRTQTFFEVERTVVKERRHLIRLLFGIGRIQEIEAESFESKMKN